MAGYSGTPLAKKLGIVEGSGITILDAPEGFGLDVPDAVTVRTAARGVSDVVVSFHTTRSSFERRLGPVLRSLHIDGGWWVAWPKRASKVPTDMTEDVVRAVGLPIGLVDNKVCAIDETWSGLRLVVRREHRAGHATAAEAIAAVGVWAP